MHVLLATDADWIVDEVTAALGGPDTSFTVVRDGRHVSRLVADRAPDVVITDLQVGNMGGMAITMGLRLDATAGQPTDVPIVMLLDRVADEFLARRSGADAWLVKPLDALGLRRAVTLAIEGPVDELLDDEFLDDELDGEFADDEYVDDELAEDLDAPEEEAAPAG